MIHLFGIRHHGPGSAHSLVNALQTLKPDIILLEGPVEAEAILPFAANPAMKPPVAVLVYGSVAEEPEPRAAFFPFAEFSPEWQAIQYGLKHTIPLRFIDLPQAYNLADNWQAPSPSGSEAEGEGVEGRGEDLPKPSTPLAYSPKPQAIMTANAFGNI
jgi:hypothetical protein